MAKKEQKPIWTCDRCKKKHIGGNYPTSVGNNWGTLKIDQNAGFDMHGVAWSPRMRKPLLLCGDCIEEIVSVVNNKNLLKTLQHHQDTTIGLWATDQPERLSDEEKTKYNMFEIRG